MRLFFVVLILALTNHSIAQTYDFKDFDDENIRSAFIYQITQDKKGDLWLAHSKGLSVYDGLSFKQYDKKTGLLDDFIEHIEVDSANKIWFSYYNGGYGYIDHNKIFNIDTSKYVTHIKVNHNGKAYVATQDKIYTYFNSDKDSLDITATKIEFLKNNTMLWLDDEQNLYSINSKNHHHQLLKDVQLLSANILTNIAACVSNDTLKIIRVNANGIHKIISIIDLKKFNLEISNINLFSNYLEISTLNNGVLEIKFNADYTAYSIKLYNNEKGLQSNHVYTTFLDKEKNLWIGCYGNGLLMLPNSRISVYNKGFENTAVYAVTGFENTLFLATEHGLIKTKESQNKTKFFLQQFKIKTIYKRNNELWVGTENGGLYRYKNNQLKQLHFTSNIQPKTINCIQFEDETIIVGTNSGLYLYNFYSKETKHITTNEGLAHNVVEYFMIDNSRTFWFDSPNSPVYSYQNGEFSYYKNIDGFESFNITDITQLGNGEIWFTTAGDGVFKYSKGKFTNYNKNDGLFANYVYFINEISHNTVLLGHKKGITTIEITDTVPNIRHSGNIDELEFILPQSYYVAGGKNLWIGSSNGLINVPLNYIQSSKYQPQLFIENIQISSDNIGVKDTVNLSYNNYYVEIEFKTILLSNPQSISYQWKLEGFDKNWNYGTYKDTKARYQSLKDGKYKFKVKLLINDMYSGQSKTIVIHIEKPYWKKTWFYVSVFISLILAIILVFYLYNLRNIKLRKILVKKVDERTKELNKKNTELKLLSQEYLKEKNIVEQQSKELIKSINYAKRIQKAMLQKPIYAEWINIFKELFLLYKPKDKVSGDFYWAHKKDKYFYIAIGDCTGHGVPGAMISMLGTSSLTEVLGGESEPNIILNELRKRVTNQLGSGDFLKYGVSLRDGMDLALIKYNIETKEAQSASAYNPIYILRDKSKPIDENLKVIMERDNLVLCSTYADKQPVGACEKMKDFTLNTFQLYTDDHVFMFSDGYYDQFGGPRNKKFLRKRFIELLFKTYNLNAKQQKKLLQTTIENWMKNFEQIDDITVLGFVIK